MRNAPLTARSVMASALLGLQPPELPVAQLIRLCSLFDIGENRTRVALSRMVAAGEAVATGPGRYRLTGPLLERQRRQQASRAGGRGRWDGDWHLAVVTTSGSSAEVRAARRRDLRFARLAELREGLWLRPANLPLDLPPATATDTARFAGRPEADPVRLAARLWPLDRWADEAESLRRQMEALPPSAPEDLAPGFVLSAAVLRHLQGDPLLPTELLPARWPGEQLRADYDGWDRRYRSVLGAWSRAR